MSWKGKVGVFLHLAVFFSRFHMEAKGPSPSNKKNDGDHNRIRALCITSALLCFYSFQSSSLVFLFSVFFGGEEVGWGLSAFLCV